METLRGVFPQPKVPPKRNFIKENVSKLRSKSNTALQKNLEGEPSKAAVSNRYSGQDGIRTKRNANDNLKMKPRLSKSQNNLCDQFEKIGLPADSKTYVRIDSATSVVRDNCSQTTDTEDDQFLKDVIIRLPSASVLQKIKQNHNIAEETLQLNLNDLEPYSTVQKDGNNERNLDEDNLTIIDYDDGPSYRPKIHNCTQQLSVPQKNQQGLPASYRIGEVPKYLQTLRSKQEQKQIEEASKDLDCPPGHYLLSEQERCDALKITQKGFDELIDELNRMPMTTETMKARRRKIEIERELDQLEVHLRTFSRPKVYVPIDQK